MSSWTTTGEGRTEFEYAFEEVGTDAEAAGLATITLNRPAARSAQAQAQVALGDTDDYREGFAAFQQKRPPVFRGR